MARKLKRYVISSDRSEFVGRIYDLSVVGLHFASYDEMSVYPDAKYALEVNERTSLLARRVESLNHVGDLLWPEKPTLIGSLPVSAYDYCNLIQDTFLMRIISVLDCCCILLAEVLELNMNPRQVNVASIRKLSPENSSLKELENLSELQSSLRAERNVRFHRAEEEWFTDDDETFKMVALWSHRGRPMSGKDRHGRKIDLDRFYRLATFHLQKKFNANSKILAKALEEFYVSLKDDFEERFVVKCRAEGSYMRKTRESPSG